MEQNRRALGRCRSRTLRRIHAIDGVNGTRATVVLETLFERPVSPRVADQE
ncbi:hypothetical protein [Streptomyces sp. NPDC058240]|uniref:hypothetical protein n=1 Tax=Streptomyces sp. NPDC058240 TaxID=3346396 RepID=UPI0036E38326